MEAGQQVRDFILKEKIESVRLRALAKDPYERFGGCQEMAKALNLESSVPPPAWFEGQRKAIIRVVAVIGAVMVTIVLIVVIFRYMTPRDECGRVEEIARGSVE